MGDGPTVFEHVCRMGLEGIVSKRTDAPYRSGQSKVWLKSKNPLSEAVRRCGGSVRRSGARPAHGHQMHELGSIDVIRLDRTPVASRCLRIKLYLDENFP
jgi:ATP-dependent DNA ligase